MIRTRRPPDNYALIRIFAAFFLLGLIYVVLSNPIGYVFDEWGFTTLMTLCVIVPAIGAWLILFLYRYYAAAFTLVPCGMAFAIFTLTLLHEQTLTKPAPPTIPITAASQDNLIEIGETHTYVVVKDRDDSNTQAATLAPPTLTIHFPEIETFGGEWTYLHGLIRTYGALDKQILAYTADNKADYFTPSIRTRPARTTPYLVVSVPIETSHLDEDIEITARLTVEYWEGHRAIVRETYRRDFIVTVRHENELRRTQEAFTRYDNAKHAIEVFPGVPLLIGGMIVSLGVGYAFIRWGKVLQRPDSGRITLWTKMIRIIPNNTFVRGVGIELLDPHTFIYPRELVFGAIVGRVTPYSPAAQAGLMWGDIIQKVDGYPILTRDDFHRRIKAAQQGEVILLTVWRYGTLIELFLQL